MMRLQIKILHLLLLVVFQIVQADLRVDPLVETKVGLIRGLKASDGDYSMFMGIPYAKVNEDNPFGPSTAYPKFDDVFEAFDDSAICPQTEQYNNTVTGTLDCLHLNIYVPNTASSQNRLPVLVWIYGGNFHRGFAGRYEYGPKYLVRHDVILVTFNYRVGPFGFMCLDTAEVPGNQGLKDQLIALRWINNNIEAFGGDVSKITLFGESAGARSVDLHVYSEHEKLFNNVIMDSGSAIHAIRVFQDSDRTAPIKLAEQLGFETNNFTAALSFISKIDPKLVNAAADQIGASYKPCVEKDIEGVEKFISDYSINKNIPKAKGIHVLTGYNNDELISTYINEETAFFETLEVFNDLLNGSFTFEEAELVKMEEIVRHFYLGDEVISERVKHSLADFESDFTYNYPTTRTISEYMANGADKIFFYVFSYVGQRNFVRRKNNITSSDAYAAHADEIGYLFDISFISEVPTNEDQLVIDRMTTMWTNFVKYGDPTPETSDLLPFKWEPVTKDSLLFLDINLELRLGSRPFHDRMAFWDLFYQMNRKFEKGFREDETSDRGV